MPFNFSGLHTKCFFCSAITVGCLGFHEPICEGGGLPLNLLLLGPTGVISIVDDSLDCGSGDDTLEVLHTLCGSHTNDCRPMTLSGRIGVFTFELDSVWKVAIEALLLGWKALWLLDVVAWDGLTAIEPRLGFRICFVWFSLDMLLFSLASFTTGR